LGLQFEHVLGIFGSLLRVVHLQAKGVVRMDRKTARWPLVGLALIVALFIVTASAQAAELPYYWYGGGSENCWQTGAFTSESHKCDYIGANFLEVPGRMINVSGSTSTSGDYCVSYVGDALNKQDAANEAGATGFGTPTPYGSFQEWDGYGNVCQANGEGFGHEIQPKAPGNNCTSATCGMHHTVSFAEQGTSDRPWSTSVNNPELVISTEATVQTFAGTNPSGWGYVCPLFEDTVAPHNILEYCLQEWRGSGNEAAWTDERIGTCAPWEGHRNFDTVQSFFYPGTRFATQDSGSVNTTVASAGWKLYKASITGADLVNAIELDRTAYKQKPGSREANPELGYGCGRSAELSTNPANYALIGIEQGAEAWQTGGSSYSELGVGEYNLNVSDQFSYRAPEATTGSATELRGASATLNGTVNPWGASTNAYVEYGLTTSYGKSAGPQNPTGLSPAPVSFGVTGLTPSTTYHYRLKAQSSGGEVHSEDKTFTTPSLPVVTTTAASEIHEATANFNGTVNPAGLDTHYYFKYGTTPSYGKTAPLEPGNDAGSGSTTVPVSVSVTGLSPGTKYYYRIVATSYAGTSEGTEQTFTTAGPIWEINATPAPVGGTNVSLSTVSCPSSTVCIGVGEFKNSSGTWLPLAENWNGTEWQLMSPPSPAGAKTSYFEGVACFSLTACTAVGSYTNSSGVHLPLAERWNGTTWTIQEAPSPTGAETVVLRAVTCESATACTAVGSSTKSGTYSTLAESWNGTSWSIQAIPNSGGLNYMAGVSCVSTSACTAVGSQYVEPILDHWNGTEWVTQKPANAPGFGDTFAGVFCPSITDCIAVGAHSGGALVEVWNGTTWSTQSVSGPSGAKSSGLSTVSCTAATACTAVGSYENSSGTTTPFGERWNGTEWKVLPAMSPSGATVSYLPSISCALSTKCVAVGSYKTSAGATLPLAESLVG
jgi:hypothetical protein